MPTTHVESGQTVRMTGRAYPLPTSSIGHERNHEGVMYHAGIRNETLGDNGILDLMLVVNSIEVHGRVKATCGGDASYSIYEDPFTDANSLGAAVIPHNRHRHFGEVSQSSLYSAPFIDVNSLGEAIDGSAVIAGGAGGNAGGGNNGSEFFEWTMKIGSSYLFRLINRGGAAKIAANEIDFYEKDV